MARGPLRARGAGLGYGVLLSQRCTCWMVMGARVWAVASARSALGSAGWVTGQCLSVASARFTFIQKNDPTREFSNLSWSKALLARRWIKYYLCPAVCRAGPVPGGRVVRGHRCTHREAQVLTRTVTGTISLRAVAELGCVLPLCPSGHPGPCLWASRGSAPHPGCI